MSAPADGTRHATPREIDRHLVAGLSRAIDWIDNSLQQVLASRGFKPVHRTQSLILLHIASGIDSPADIAREMGLTRQNVHQMARGLIQDGLIQQQPHPRDPRRSKYSWTEQSQAIRAAALETLRDLETAIQRRAEVSDQDMEALRRVLAADWGGVITSAAELRALLEDD